LVDENGVLIAGHGRVGAAARLQLTSIPVIVARGWTDEEKQAYRLADNELAARASWDPDLLRNELRDLKFSGFDLELIGFEPDRLEDILAGLGSRGLTDPDSVPEVREQPGHAAGRSMAVGRPPRWLWRCHQLGGCHTSAGRSRASSDGYRSSLRGRL
jgi:ParB-like chromosome segregation protein Spo0J